jgi:Cu/Ag efflux protein CusF
VKLTFHDRNASPYRALIAVLICCSFVVSPLLAQQAASQTTRGTVTKIDPATQQLTIKTDAGQDVDVKMAANARYQRVGADADLTKATTIAIADVGAGDHVIAVGKPGDDKVIAATRLIVMSKGDIAGKQASEMADWQKRGIIGTVNVTTSGDITVNVRGPGGAKPVVITPAPNAVIRRYTPDSIKFQDAKPSALAEIKNGDQVRARGERSADGGKMTADEIVSGTFKELAATVISVDAAEKVLRVTDLATKKPVTIKISADSNLRRLPLQMAQMLAAQNRPPEEGAAPGGRGGGAPQGRGGDAPQGRSGDGRGPGGPGGGGRGRGARDLGAMLDQTPVLNITELKKDDAIIVLSTVGANDQLNVITMLAGVEDILRKPGTREMSLGGWSLEGGGGGGN